MANMPPPADRAADLAVLRAAAAAAVDRIVEEYRRRLQLAGNPIGNQDQALLEANVRGMLAGLLTGDPTTDDLPAIRGRAHAVARVSPVHAMSAIRVLSDVVGAEVVAVAEVERVAPAVVARALADLFATLMRRVELSGGAYAVALLGDLHTTHLTERRRIARDLHDKVAHTLAIAPQQHELHEIALDRGDARSAHRHDERLRDLLTEATDVVREIGEDIGRLHTERGLTAAVGDYAELTGTGLVRCAVVGRERLDGLAPWVAEEFYLAIRESIRNAVEHADASVVTVDLAGELGQCTARISDDGIGFSAPAGRSDSAGRGLPAVRDRVA